MTPVPRKHCLRCLKFHLINGARYYDEMSDSRGARSRNYYRGRAQDSDRGRSDRRTDPRRDDRPSEGTRGYPPSRPGPAPGGPPAPRPSTSAGTSSGSYHTTARGEQHRSADTRPSHSETGSETASIAGSTTGESSTAARGAMRGRRVLPVNIITRPRTLTTKQGSHGMPVSLKANYFKLLTTTDWSLYKYCVDYNPPIDHNVIKKALLREHREKLGAYIFDGSQLYTSTRLPSPLTLTSVRNAHAGGNGIAAREQEVIEITIKETGEMTKGDHHYLQFFNIIMRKCLDYLELKLVGRNYFDPYNKAEVREFRLELWPGYVTSIRQHEHDILMCAEIAHKVMRSETLLDVLGDCYHNNPQNYQNAFTNAVLGTVVLTDYNNNTYKIDDVDYSVSPSSTFTKKNGETISYFDYYRAKYNINIQNAKQPLLVSKAKQRDRRAGVDEVVYLIPELCRSTGINDNMRKNFKLMSALAKYTRVSPFDRMKKLAAFNQRLYSVPNVVQELTSWNLKLDTNLVNLTGRVLPTDEIIFPNAKVKINPDAKWTNQMRDKVMLSCGKLDNWALIVPEKAKQGLQQFVQALTRVAGAMNFIIGQPRVYDIRDDNPGTYADCLDYITSKSSPMLICCVVLSNRLDRYTAIKKKCCVDKPVPTQVLIKKSTDPGKSMMSIATKVAIQMNCKIGGIPWSISIPLNGLMVVGFDVCHDAGSREKDFGAMVASLDANFGRYYSAVSSHTNGEELSNDLSVNLCKALDTYKRYNASLPKRILIYRDGVGEGQVHFVLQHEVAQIKAKLEKIYERPENVKLGYVIVTKKINTRLFAKEGSGNPLPGTIVDDVVTDPTRYDFLIVAQHVTQGTVTPTSYNVIEDTTGLDADKLQRITYKLCHLYFNWSGTVRVPAPCQYAHKLAFLVSQAIHTSPSTTLETLLYFL
uniref:Piwi domain-containing protein n=1 Tax=Trichogramma kaykai TaxID=54128 RepID=A0ABD2WLF8_9HYME